VPRLSTPKQPPEDGSPLHGWVVRRHGAHHPAVEPSAAEPRHVLARAAGPVGRTSRGWQQPALAAGDTWRSPTTAWSPDASRRPSLQVSSLERSSRRVEPPADARRLGVRPPHRRGGSLVSRRYADTSPPRSAAPPSSPGTTACNTAQHPRRKAAVSAFMVPRPGGMSAMTCRSTRARSGH